MIFKVLALAGVLFLVYIVFFKRNRENTINKTKKDEEIDTMTECPTCKVFVARDDSILSNGRYFCSKECLNK